MSTPDDPQVFADAMPFAKACGVEIHEAEPQQVTGALAWSPERCTVGGVLHGGALMTLVDSVGAVCAFLNLRAGGSTSTIDSTTSFLRAVRGAAVTAVSRPLHVGQTVIAVRTEVRDSDGRLVAHSVQHQAVRRPDTKEEPS
jgi:1,4-dihydroxy-2-naphthoyl-CoA hydrolase